MISEVNAGLLDAHIMHKACTGRMPVTCFGTRRLTRATGDAEPDGREGAREAFAIGNRSARPRWKGAGGRAMSRLRAEDGDAAGTAAAPGLGAGRPPAQPAASRAGRSRAGAARGCDRVDRRRRDPRCSGRAMPRRWSIRRCSGRSTTAAPEGRIAVAYVEWAAVGAPGVVVDWMVVADEASARAVRRAADGGAAARLRPRTRSGRRY